MQISQFQTLIDTIQDNGRNPALEVRTILTAIKNEVFKVNEIKMIFMTPLEITANFDNTGLGIGNSVGYARCNGLNGTQNYSRKVPVGYDSTIFVSGFDYSGVGNTFGEEKHTLTIPELPTNNKSVHTEVAGTTSGGGSGRQPWSPNTVNFGGSDVAHNNIQPSIVTLFIQRVS